MTKAHEDLEIKTNALNAELEKVEVSEVLIQTGPKIKEVSNVKEEENETHDEEKFKVILCKYFHQIKGCRRRKKDWFYHDQNIRQSIKVQTQSNPQLKSSKLTKCRKKIKRRAGWTPKASYYRSVKAVTKRK